jgi:Fic family protein
MKINIEKHKEIKISSLHKYIGKEIIIDFYSQEFHKFLVVTLKSIDNKKRQLLFSRGTKTEAISFKYIYAVYERREVKPFIPQTLPIKINWSKLTSLISEANRELGVYNGLLQSIPNTEVIFSPLTTQEAVLSSKIEGTVATLEDVLNFEAKTNINVSNYDDIEEVRNYRKALDEAFSMIKKGLPISLRLIKAMHTILMQGVRGENRDPGNFRRIQNWIGKPNSTITTAEFIPPSPDKLMEYLDNLEKYIHFEEKDKLVQLAIIHAQFEIIHPFLDGNGRIGRLLIPIFLFEKALLPKPLFYISAYFESDRETYYKKLRAITASNNWNDWIEYFLVALKEQTSRNIKLANDIIKLHDELKQKIMEITGSKYAIKILDLLFEKPVFSTKHFRDSLNAKPPVIKRNLDKLLAGKIIQLTEKGSGTRPSIYKFSALFKVSDFPLK